MRCFALLLLFAITQVIDAAPRGFVCGPSGCFRVPESVPDSWEWKVNVKNPDQVDLYRNGQSYGSYFKEEGEFYLYSNRTWTARGNPPVAVPAEHFGRAGWGRDYFFGVDPECCNHGENYSINGRSASKSEVYRALAQGAGPELGDDSGLRHLTAIGKDAEATLVLRREFGGLLKHPKLKEFRVQIYDVSRKVDRVMCEPFRLDADERFQAAGSVVYVQRPEQAGKGEVQVAQYGTPTVDSVLDGLRKVDPTFDPQRNPPAKPPSKPVLPDAGPTQPSAVNLTPLIFAGALVCGAGFMIRRK